MKFLFLLLLLLASRFIYATDTINWYVYDRPPSHFLSGPNIGQGYLDKLLDITVNELNEYQHTKVKATIARGLREMKQGHNACHLSLFKNPEREKFTAYSIAHIMAPNLSVIMSKKLAKSHHLSKEVSVEALFSQHKLKAIKLPERSYTEHVDNIFAKYPTFIYNRPTFSELGLYQMLESGRVDFLVAVPSTANYLLGESSADFESLAIQGIEKYGLAYIGCSKTPWGKRVISKIDKILIKAKTSDAYLQAMSSWLPAESVNEEYMEYYRNTFLTN